MRECRVVIEVCQRRILQPSVLRLSVARPRVIK